MRALPALGYFFSLAVIVSFLVVPRAFAQEEPPQFEEVLSRAMAGEAAVATLGGFLSHGYDLDLAALRGPEVTDLTLTIIPPDAESVVEQKLHFVQIWIKNPDGSRAGHRHFAGIPLVANEATIELEGLERFQTLEVMVLLKQEVAIEVPGHGKGRIKQLLKKIIARPVLLRESTTVFNRPDLVVSSFSAPSTAGEDIPFDVSAQISEVNGDVEATATVVLYEGVTILGSIPGVLVDPASSVGVVFTGLRLTGTGAHELTLAIEHAQPLEYDVTNNQQSVVIEVVGERALAMAYVMDYQHDRNIIKEETFSGATSGGVTYSETQRWEGSRDALNYYAVRDLEGMTPYAPLERFAWKVETEQGIVFEGSLENVAPSFSDPSGAFDLYTVFLDNAEQVQASVMVDRVSQFASFSVSKYAEDIVYTFSASTGQADTVVTNEGVIGATGWLSVALLIEDDELAAGGTAEMTLTPFEEVSTSSSGPFGRFIPGVGLVLGTRTVSETFETSFTSQSGRTDSTVVPQGLLREDGGKLPDDLVLPMASGTELAPNYPNPFNPTTNLQFSVMTDGPAVLRVYNAIGQEVATLFDGYAVSGRFYTAAFDARELPSGFYYARLEAAGQQQVRKMLLVK